MARKKAEENFNNAVEISENMGVGGFLGLIYLEMGLFYKAKKNIEPARKYLLKGIDIFKARGADIYLKQAQEALENS